MISRFLKPAQIFTVLVAVFFGGSVCLRAWSPGTNNPQAAANFTIDTRSRSEVLSFYNCIYNASQNYAANIAWSGNATTHISGTTSTLFKEDVRRRINFYRALAGVPSDIVFDANYSSLDQDAALLFAVNNRLSHTPDPSWSFFLTTGSTGARNSNIALGNGIDTYGPPAIDGYMVDAGDNNKITGHRRWLLYSQQQTMGTGDIPPSTVTVSGSTYQNVSANAIWISGPFKTTSLLQAVSWPNAGYVPLPLMPARWSISYPNADFSAATVTMQKSGTNVGLTIISKTDNGYGENSLVWEPVGLPASIAADTSYSVSVSGVKVSGTQTSFSYNVTLFDPSVLGSTLVISGTNAPFTTGGTYTFNAIPSADSYQLRVSSNNTVPWTEGAEDSPAPQITVSTTGTYSLRQSVVKRTGIKAFQLAFPDGYCSDQSFVITRDIVPSATSQLQFYDLMRFMADTTALFAQVSSDNGNTWTTIWTRTGTPPTDPNFGSSAAWDTSFHAVSASLSAYAGQIIKIRFLYHFVGGEYAFFYDPTDETSPPFETFGIFIDDITVTNAGELVNTTTTTLSGTATSFVLNSTTAGGTLVSGSSYALRVRPSVGLRWYGDSAMLNVTAQSPMSYSDWVTKLYPSVTGGPTADADHDAITNGMEFAYGLNPTVHNTLTALPQPTVTSGTMGVTFTQPDGVIGVTYKAEWSTDLVNWTAITDTGVSPVHTFTVSPAGNPRAFFRYKVILEP